MTGFETSANYIEEAGPFVKDRSKITGEPRVVSVFERTIAYMWLLVMVVNPTITTLSLGERQGDAVMSYCRHNNMP